MTKPVLPPLPTDHVLTAADLAASGVPAREVTTRLRRGELLRLDRGWYTEEVAADDRRLHLLRTIAMVRRYDGRAAASHASGALLLGLPVPGPLPEAVQLTRLDATHGRRRDEVHLHRQVPGLRAIELPGTTHPVLCLSAATVAIQCGMAGRPVDALVVADAALRSGQAARSELARAVLALRRCPGVTGVRDALPHADGRHESPGETRTAALLRRWGFRAEPQIEIRVGARVYRVDFLVEGPVAVEYDGRAKYGEGADLIAEKRREDDLRSVGLEVVRIMSEDLAQPHLIVARVKSAQIRARRSAGA